MLWFESAVFALFPPFVAGVLYPIAMGVLDFADTWKGWWIPPWVAGRVSRAVLPGAAELGRFGDSLHAPVSSSPATLREHWRRGVRRSGGIDTWLLVFALIPSAVFGSLAAAGLDLTVRPSAADDPAFVRNNTLPFFSLSAGLGSAAFLWLHRSGQLYRRRIGESLPLTSAVELAKLLRRCQQAADGTLPLLELDRHVTRYTNRLGWFAAYGVDRERRRDTLRPHIAKVQQALEREASNVLRDGPAAVPGLARLVATLLDRSVQGRWMGLLDEADLPPEPVDLVAGREDRHDRLVVLVGSIAAAGIVGAAAFADLPASVVAPAALTALIGPAVMWGSEKLSGTRRLFDAQTAGLSSAAAPTPAPAEPGPPIPEQPAPAPAP
ncbi:hypothetical protein [Kitasatospora sp. NPDC056273]|uniref:hypothetical protein n=1 Tax=unclassified Kitasatospora TaxID=2633591 RepID=UPI0035E11EE9